MAQKVEVLLTCDLEEGDKPGTQTIEFGLDGASYEIDLCDKHAKQFRDSVALYVTSSRRAAPGRSGGSRRSRAGGRSGSDRERTQVIREWARKKGLKVSERGRLSAEIVAQYEAGGGK